MVAAPTTVAMSTSGIVHAVNGTVTNDLPPLPAYSTELMPDLFPNVISDFWLSIIAPHVVYWAVSMIFHLIDVYDLFPQYRLHTPEEISQRNLASRWQVARDVVIEQIIQMLTAAVLSLTEPAQLTGMEDYEVAVWATRIRLAQRSLPTMLGMLGLNAAAISKNMAASYPLLAGALAGGHYPFLTTRLDATSVPAFATWELMLAKAIYWLVVPGFQMWVAVAFLDSWQYFWHRAMHVNKWMYSTLALPMTSSPFFSVYVANIRLLRSPLARPPPPPLCPLCLRRTLQPSRGGIRSGHCRRGSCLQGQPDVTADGNRVLRVQHNEDGR